MIITQRMNLTEYHCKKCNKLLCKGKLTDRFNMLEVKCRGCRRVCFFRGPDSEIIKQRSALIKSGLIQDPEKE